ncbi:ATP-binding protein [uncultured Stenotrophomonas sp.]|uniref:ATP-binding protein n=1 Tax=uncultured Stenotrophomonas sp. TaxID=165438 RepID=UPI0025F7820C|nr:ATP-binding protein [uncultured Stenotrophomonas sp.]
MKRRAPHRHAPFLLLLALLLLPAASAEDAQSHQWLPGREVRVATPPSLRPLPAGLAGTAPLPTLAHGYADLVTRHSGLQFKEHPYPSTEASVRAVCRGDADLVLVVGAAGHPRPPCAHLVPSTPFRGGRTLLAGRTDDRLPHDITQLHGRTLAVVNGGPYAGWLAAHHPLVPLLHLPDRHAALSAVEAGMADVAIGVESTLQPMIRQHFASTLQVQPFEMGFSTDMRLLARREDQQLLARIDQALQDITLEEHAGLLQVWAGQILSAPVEKAKGWMRMPPPAWLLVVLVLLAGLPVLWLWLHQQRGRDLRRQTRAAGVISHEIRNSAQVVLASIDLLSQSLAPKQQRELLAAAKAAGHALRGMLNRSLEFARLAEGGFTPRAQPCDALLLCRQSLDAIRPQALLKGLELRFEAIPERAPAVTLDPEGLRQIVDNLLANAVKFTDIGGIDLRVQLRPAIDPQELLVDVIDSGIGIDARQAARLFQPFQQGKDGQVRGGSGLGLAIARELTHAMRGTLTLHSVPDRGSRFTLRLPAQIAKTGLPPAEPTPSGLPLVGLDLLLVEDHAMNRQIIAEQLRRLGANVHALADAADALAEQARYPRRIVLVDIGLQGMDGYTLARQLRSQPGKPPRLIALSARTGRRHRARCRDAGFHAVLAKPLQIGQLLQALELPPAAGAAAPEAVAPLDQAYLADINGELLGIARAAQECDATALRHHAHRLQGTLQFCGATDQVGIAADLWELGNDAAPDWVDVRRLLQVLQRWHGSRSAEAMPPE